MKVWTRGFWDILAHRVQTTRTHPQSDTDQRTDMLSSAHHYTPLLYRDGVIMTLCYDWCLMNEKRRDIWKRSGKKASRRRADVEDVVISIWCRAMWRWVMKIQKLTAISLFLMLSSRTPALTDFLHSTALEVPLRFSAERFLWHYTNARLIQCCGLLSTARDHYNQSMNQSIYLLKSYGSLKN